MWNKSVNSTNKNIERHILESIQSKEGELILQKNKYK